MSTSKVNDSPRIFYLAYDHNVPRGGQKATYQHVDALNKHGYDAFVVHGTYDNKVTWFPHATRVIDRSTFTRLYSPIDFVVVPEDLGMKIFWVPGKKVIYNKGVALGFRALGLDISTPTPYEQPEVVAILAASPHNARQLKFACPDKDIYVTYLPLDVDVLPFVTLASKAPLIAYVPKNIGLLTWVANIARSRSQRGLNKLGAFKLLELGHLPREQYLDALKRALAVLFLNVEEGIGFTAVEAMACGALLIGFRGKGVVEDIYPQHEQLKILDPIPLVTRLEEITFSFPHGISKFQAEADSGRQYALRFSYDLHESSVISAWKQIFERWGQTIFC